MFEKFQGSRFLLNFFIFSIKGFLFICILISYSFDHKFTLKLKLSNNIISYQYILLAFIVFHDVLPFSIFHNNSFVLEQQIFHFWNKSHYQQTFVVQPDSDQLPCKINKRVFRIVDTYTCFSSFFPSPIVPWGFISLSSMTL